MKIQAISCLILVLLLLTACKESGLEEVSLFPCDDPSHVKSEHPEECACLAEVRDNLLLSMYVQNESLKEFLAPKNIESSRPLNDHRSQEVMFNLQLIIIVAETEINTEIEKWENHAARYHSNSSFSLN